MSIDNYILFHNAISTFLLTVVIIFIKEKTTKNNNKHKNTPKNSGLLMGAVLMVNKLGGA